MSICVEQISFAYDTQNVLHNVSFQGNYGEFISVLGPNGVGKSTLFRCMLGLLEPSKGEILLDGKNIRSLKAEEMAKTVAYIPQFHDPAFNFSVFDMVLMGTTAQIGKFSSPGRTQKKQAKEALERLGILQLKDKGYRNISGGEQQLVLIARALAQQAKILVMDEPSASLDFGNRLRVMQTVKKLTKEGYLVIQSTHDPEQAYQYSDKILALCEGKILAWGTPQEIISESLISKLYDVDVKVCSLQNDSIRVCVSGIESVS